MSNMDTLPKITPEIIRELAEGIGERVKGAEEGLHYQIYHSPDRETPSNRPAICCNPACKYWMQDSRPYTPR